MLILVLLPQAVVMMAMTRRQRYVNVTPPRGEVVWLRDRQVAEVQPWWRGSLILLRMRMLPMVQSAIGIFYRWVRGGDGDAIASVAAGRRAAGCVRLWPAAAATDARSMKGGENGGKNNIWRMAKKKKIVNRTPSYGKMAGSSPNQP